jgi:ring-1,2-phenylacetyl-CoA epoxidase subunit PaaC
MRYAEWCVAAPSLEADIAAAAMGLDDIGHSRVLYGSLKELGSPEAGADDPAVYRNVPYLDRPWTEWAQFVAANAVLDGAFSLMIEALASGQVEVLRSRLKKMLQEEQYHYLHGRSWMRETDATAQVQEAWGQAIAWIGPEGGDVDQLHAEGKLGLGVTDLTGRLEERLEAKAPARSIDWNAWDPIRRRTVSGGIDQLTLDMLQGLAEKRYMPASG